MAGHLIRRLNQISVSIFSDKMSEGGFDLTPVQFATLNTLHENAGIDQATLAGLIAYDRVTIGGVIERLEQKQLLERQVSAKDRRAKVLVLSEDGKELLFKVRPIVAALQSDILQGLTEEESDEFIRLLGKAASGGNSRSRAPLKEMRK